MRTRKWLEKNIKGLSDVKVGKIKDAIKKMLVRYAVSAHCARGPVIDSHQPNIDGFVTGAELLEVRKRCIRISTGSKQLDSILAG